VVASVNYRCRYFRGNSKNPAAIVFESLADIPAATTIDVALYGIKTPTPNMTLAKMEIIGENL
jgi:hypothetical protein